MIAFLGTGLMGSGFVRAFLSRGEAVQVWNRTAEKARALEAHGARAFASAADAVRGASFVHLSLSDDASVESALEQARPGLAQDAVIIDHTTTAPGPTRERIRRFTEAGFTYLHAPVFMGPKNAQDATGSMLTSGPKALYEQLKPRLEKMTGKLVYLGEEPERAAGFKLMGNLVIMFVASGLADMYALGKSLGISPQDAHGLFSFFRLDAQFDIRGKRMASGDFGPAFELAMARKDVRLMLETAAQNGASLEVLPVIAGFMDKLIGEGEGGKDLGVLAKHAIR